MADNKSPEILQAPRNTDQAAGDTRCTRNDGKAWRCKKPKVDGNRFCESHTKCVNGGASQAPKRRHSASDIAPSEKKPCRSSGLGTHSAPGESDVSHKSGGDHASRSFRRRTPKFHYASVVNHPWKKDGLVDHRRKTISGESTIRENKEKFMHLKDKVPKEDGTKAKETPRKADKKEAEGARSENQLLKVYKEGTGTNGTVENGLSSQQILKNEEKAPANVVSSQLTRKEAVQCDQDSDERFGKQVTRGRRPKEVRVCVQGPLVI